MSGLCHLHDGCICVRWSWDGFTYFTHVWTVPVLALGMSMKKRNGSKWMKDIERGDVDPIEILLMF